MPVQLPERIDTTRLIVRRLVPGDREAFLALMTGAENTSEFMFSDDHKSETGALALFQSVLSSYSTDSPYFLLAICQRSADGLIGLCGISNLPDVGAHEPFCCLARDRRGKGYATDAITALIDHCFRENVVSEFRVHINPNNHRSILMARRLHFRYAGEARHPTTGEDSEMYAMSARDWSGVNRQV